MTPSALGTQATTSKIKRLQPSNIQAIGPHSSSPSPPQISAGHPPSSAKSLNSAGSNFAGNSSPSTRSVGRRRDVSQRTNGHERRNSTVGLQSGSSASELALFTSNELQPYIKSDEYILKKYRNDTPSLVIHLHPTHFRFDNQEGHFPYQSPMRVMIEHLRQRTIPHDLVEYFGDIPYYEDCLIVQVHDHKSIASSQPAERENSPETTQILFSVHNYSQYCTPSPYVPFREQSPPPIKSTIPSKKSNFESTEQQQKETTANPTVSNIIPPKPNVLTVVLHPTPMSKFVNFALKSAEVFCTDVKPNYQQDVSGDFIASVIPSPQPTVPPPTSSQSSMAPPAKRMRKSKMHLDYNQIYNMEAQINLATAAPLFLEPVSSAFGSAVLIGSLAHPMHQEEPPAPKVRKRTVAEMAADQAFAAEQERYMLILDERLSSNVSVAPGGITSAGPDCQSGGVIFEPRFEKFKLLESIRSQHEENKLIEKQKFAENEKRQKQEFERTRLKEESEKREMERKFALQLKQAQAQRQAENNRNRQILAEQARSQLSSQGAQNQVLSQNSQPRNIQSQQPQNQKSQSDSFQAHQAQAQKSQSQQAQLQNINSLESQAQQSEPESFQAQQSQSKQSQGQQGQTQQPQPQNIQSLHSQAQKSQLESFQAQASQIQQFHPQQSQSQQSQANSPVQQSQFQHGHPQNEIDSNLMPGQSVNYHQQVSSPTIRTGTPKSSSSPTVNSTGAVSMQNATSSMSGSPHLGSIVQQSHQQQPAPTSQGMTAQRSQQSHTSSPRLGSIVQQSHQQHPAPTSQGMTAQRSQQSHTSTPRILTSTPGKTTPIIRPVSRTPRTNQATPQGQIAQAAQQSKVNAINSQAQLLQQQRLQQIMMRQQQAVAQGLGVMMQGHQPSPQQMIQAQQMLRNQQQQIQNYPIQMAALTQRQASQAGMPSAINQNSMGNINGLGNIQQQIPLSLHQMRQLQQQQMLRQAHAQQIALQQQAGHTHQPNTINQAVQNQILGLAQRIYLTEKNNLISQNPNVIISEELDRQMKIQAQGAAHQQYLHARRRQQMVAAAQAAQQNEIQHSINGIQNQHQMDM